MNISPETKKISEIFSIDGEQKYFIPNYQRQYSWRNEQIETLIDDIYKEDIGYYIGNLLINQQDRKESLEVVDGQQRLTTISLIFIAIHDILNDYERFFDNNSSDEYRNEIIKKIAVIQADIRRKILFDEDLDRTKYLLLTKDQTHFNSIMVSSFKNQNIKNRTRVFVKRYLFIVETLKEIHVNFDELDLFYKKVNSTELLKITVTKLSDAFSIFSSLNSKGLPLTLVDLLKNEYLRISTKEHLREEKALEQWENFIDIFLIEDEIQVNDITQFLLNNFDALESDSSSSITKGKALDKYVNIFDSYGSNYINILIKRAIVFDFIKNGNVHQEFGKTLIENIKNLTYLDHSQSFPLLLFVFINNIELELNEEHLNQITKSIVNFFVRRNVTLRPKSSNARAQFINMNRYIIENKLRANEIVDYINNKIVSISDSNDEFFEQLVNDGIYDKSKDTTRFVLIQLERNFGNYFNKGNKDTLEEYINADKMKKSKLRWTIEHILPQGDNLPVYWKNTISPENPENAKNIQEDYVHRLGNLTLTPYNSEMGQKSFVEKKNQADNGIYVGLKNGLFLNQSIISADENWETKETWNKSDIERRSKELANKIIALFSFDN
jgi:uncharacterized protein with ParB-like and HNH nuclease domain